jgi:hypothetical protein
MAVKDLSGKHFGKLLVIERVGSIASYALWRCKCECGNVKDVSSALLVHGKTKSCGCLSAEKQRILHTTHGMTGKRVYAIWCGMISRCRLTNRNNSQNYSLKGVQVCEHWQKFENFLADMGEPDADKTIDRIDSNGNYEPSNCQWVTARVQRHNTSDALHVKFNGEEKPLAVWAEEFGIKYHTAYARFKRGLPLERVFAASDLRL